jgi:hypothetical protein
VIDWDLQDLIHVLDSISNDLCLDILFGYYIPDYKNRTSDFHAFKLLELSTNSSILAGKPAYMLIGTYQNPSAGLQKLMEIGMIIGDKAYVMQYIADALKNQQYKR